MKIAIISPSRTHLEDMSHFLESQGHETATAEGGKSRMREVADRELPDVMFVDGMCCDVSELDQVEAVTTQYPSIAVVLMCSTNTPEFLINSMRAGVREVLPSPPTAAAISAAVARVAAKIAGKPAKPVGKVFAFMSCKGGAGATFLATNLAWELAQTKSVLLIDLNLQFGDALAFVHDGKPAATIADVAKDITRLDASLLAASTVKIAPNYSMLPAPEDIGHSAEVKPEHIDAILGLAALHYDFVVVDLPRSLDTAVIKALDRASRIFAILQPDVPDLRNAVKLMQAFRSLGYSEDRLELIVNRYDKTCEIGLEHIQRALGGKRLNTVPNAYREVISSINHGEVLVRTAHTSHIARRLAELSHELSPRAEETRGLLDRIFRRA